MIAHLWYWFEVHTGTVNESGPYYGFWSGFGSDLGEVTLLAVFISAYRNVKCASCPRVALHHKVPETGQRTCDKHTTQEHHDELRRKHKLKFPFHLAHRA